MKSVHEILTEWTDGTDHPGLEGRTRGLFAAPSHPNVIVLDALARRRALHKKLERQRLRNASVHTVGLEIA